MPQEMQIQFLIADLLIRMTAVNIEVIKQKLSGFSVFETKKDDDKTPDIFIVFDKQLNSWNANTINISDFEQNKCLLERSEKGIQFKVLDPFGRQIILVQIENGTNVIQTDIKSISETDNSLLRYSLWIAFGLVFLPLKTLALHSSVISINGKSVLFLGESGTGKSTQTKLWTKCFSNCKLLNDDSPFIKIEDGTVYVYGSPWSGKGNCYKQEKYQVEAIIRLSQGKENSIKRIEKIEAFGAVFPSCPPPFTYDEYLTDSICDILSVILVQIPVYSLVCLPNKEAVVLAHDLLFPIKNIS